MISGSEKLKRCRAMKHKQYTCHSLCCWNPLRPLKSNINPVQVADGSMIFMEHWAEHFSTLLSQNNPSDPSVPDSLPDTNFVLALRSLENNKSSGPDRSLLNSLRVVVISSHRASITLSWRSGNWRPYPRNGRTATSSPFTKLKATSQCVVTAVEYLYFLCITKCWHVSCCYITQHTKENIVPESKVGFRRTEVHLTGTSAKSKRNAGNSRRTFISPS